MADQPFTPMHAVDTVGNATDAALGMIENRIARVEQLVADTHKQIARTFAGLLRDLETAPASSNGNGDVNGDSNGGVVVVVDDQPLDPKAAAKPLDPKAAVKPLDPKAVVKGDDLNADKPAAERKRRHRWI